MTVKDMSKLMCPNRHVLNLERFQSSKLKKQKRLDGGRGKKQIPSPPLPPHPRTVGETRAL